MLGINHFILSESDAKAFEAIAHQLVAEALGKAAFILDQDGQILAASGELQGLDTTSPATWRQVTLRLLGNGLDTQSVLYDAASRIRVPISTCNSG